MAIIPYYLTLITVAAVKDSASKLTDDTMETQVALKMLLNYFIPIFSASFVVLLQVFKSSHVLCHVAGDSFGKSFSNFQIIATFERLANLGKDIKSVSARAGFADLLHFDW